jgi:predicted phage-related endonuclease
MPLRFGSFAEDFVAQEYARATGNEVVTHLEPFIHPQYPFLSGHIDRFVSPKESSPVNDGGKPNFTTLLECKTANPFTKDGWGEPGSDEVPMSYLVQCAWYMLLTGCTRSDLAVLFSNTDFRIYTINQDLELENLLLDKAVAFWNEHVLKKVPPPPIDESDCKLLYPQSKQSKSVEASASILSLLSQLPDLQSQVQGAEDRISQIKQALMTHMQDADTLSLNGNVLATWKAPKPSFKLDAKTLAQEHPNLAAQYQTPIANSRRLVIKESALQKEGSL